MAFTLFPAVDVAGGQAARVVGGDVDTRITYGTTLDAALAWQADGAEWIHLVDLDAAFGRGSNAALLTEVTGRLDVNVQLSGGISDRPSLARALSTGCARVILGTAALTDRRWCARVIAAHSERIAIGLDVRVVAGPDGSVQHRLAARGSGADVGDLWETLARLDAEGCARYIVTDVKKDGTLGSPNLDLYRRVTSATTASVIASGGIAEVNDLIALAEIAAAGAHLEGAIVGSALYAGRFTLTEALEAVRRTDPRSAR